MVNPLVPAYNWFINFFNSMPSPIQSLVGLCIGLFAITIIVHIIMR